MRLLALAGKEAASDGDRSEAASSINSAVAGPGKHKFVMWLAEERRKREQAEQRLCDVQEELARSEASRREATSRWLEAATIIGGAPLQARALRIWRGSHALPVHLPLCSALSPATVYSLVTDFPTRRSPPCAADGDYGGGPREQLRLGRSPQRHAPGTRRQRRAEPRLRRRGRGRGRAAGGAFGLERRGEPGGRVRREGRDEEGAIIPPLIYRLSPSRI